MSAARVYPFEKSNASNIRTKSGDYIFLPLSRDLFFVTRRNYYACVFFRTIYMYVLYVCCSAKSMYILIIDFGGLKEKHAPVIKYENVYVHRGNYFISARCFYVIRTSRDVKLRRQIFLRRTFKLIVSQPIRDFGGCLAKCYVIIV